MRESPDGRGTFAFRSDPLVRRNAGVEGTVLSIVEDRAHGPHGLVGILKKRRIRQSCAQVAAIIRKVIGNHRAVADWLGEGAFAGHCIDARESRFFRIPRLAQDLFLQQQYINGGILEHGENRLDIVVLARQGREARVERISDDGPDAEDRRQLLPGCFRQGGKRQSVRSGRVEQQPAQPAREGQRTDTTPLRHGSV